MSRPSPGTTGPLIRNRAAKGERGLNSRLKPADHQFDIRVAEAGGGPLEHLQSGAVDVVRAGQIDDDATEAIGMRSGQNTP